MEILHHHDKETLYITIVGRFDTMTASKAETIVKQVLQAETEIMFDFEQLEYISSAGLRVMLLIAKIIEQRKGRIRIKNMNEEVYEVFEITAMCDLFDIM